MLVLAVFASCSKDGDEEETIKDIDVESARGIKFTTIESDKVLNNPFMGWVPWGNSKNYHQPHRMFFAQTI